LKNHIIESSSPGISGQSFLMTLSIKLGLRKLGWSLRRLHCPVPAEALVLEVGAGGNPYPRANVLLDAMEDTIERNEKALITDRPLVLGLCESLPFKDKAFDYVIASHVLEHSDDPEKFLSELMRVSKAGYIETPEGWFEKMCAFVYHRLEVSHVNGKLLIRKKVSWRPEEIALLWNNKLASSKPLHEFLVSNPELNHMRFYWEGTIDFEIVNPEESASWEFPPEASEILANRPPEKTIKSQIRDVYLRTRRWLYSQNSRNKKINLHDLLACPNCFSSQFTITNSNILCNECAAEYQVKNGIPRLFPNDVKGFERTHS
jgi:SAM-dependent methyltransferase